MWVWVGARTRVCSLLALCVHAILRACVRACARHAASCICACFSRASCESVNFCMQGSKHGAVRLQKPYGLLGTGKRGGWGGRYGGGGRTTATVTTRMTPALWHGLQCKPYSCYSCFINCEGLSHKTASTDHNFWREWRTEAPSAYQPNALPLGLTDSPFCMFVCLIICHWSVYGYLCIVGFSLICKAFRVSERAL